MSPLLLLLLFLLPIVEMYLLIRVGSFLGAWPTILIVLAAGAAGIAILRRQGPVALNRVLARMQSGEVPARELAEGTLLALAGLLLLVPGFVTDVAGILLLVPDLRRQVVARLVGRSFADGRASGDEPVVIEGEFERRADDSPKNLRDDP